MCIAVPRPTNPLHLLQLANATLLPSLPLLLSAEEIQALQVCVGGGGCSGRGGCRTGNGAAGPRRRRRPSSR